MTHKCLGFVGVSRFGELARVLVACSVLACRTMEDASPGGEAPSSRSTVPTLTHSDLPVFGLGMPVVGPSSPIDTLASQDRVAPSGSTAGAFNRTVPAPALDAELPPSTSQEVPGSNPGHVPNHPSQAVDRAFARMTGPGNG